MSEVSNVKLSCACGAQMTYSERVSEPYFSHLAPRVYDFLKAHEVCRSTKKKPKGGAS